MTAKVIMPAVPPKVNHCETRYEASQDEHVHGWKGIGEQVVATAGADPTAYGTTRHKGEHECCSCGGLFCRRHKSGQVKTTSDRSEQRNIDESRYSEDTKKGKLVVKGNLLASVF
jgi:hypothetical protein